MAVCIAAIAVFGFYIAAIPVNFALVLHIDAHPGFGAGFAGFERRFALRGAKLRSCGEKPQLKWKRSHPKPDKAAALPALWKAGKYLLRHTHLEGLRASGRLCTGDAAQTAIICGCANALEGTLMPFAPPGAVRLRLHPDFSDAQSDVELCGMVSVRLGHIILAALIGAWNYILRRIKHGKASD